MRAILAAAALLLTALLAAAPPASAGLYEEVCHDLLEPGPGCGAIGCLGVAEVVCYTNDELGNCYPVTDPCTLDPHYPQNVVRIVQDNLP